MVWTLPARADRPSLHHTGPEIVLGLGPAVCRYQVLPPAVPGRPAGRGSRTGGEVLLHPQLLDTKVLWSSTEGPIELELELTPEPAGDGLRFTGSLRAREAALRLEELALSFVEPRLGSPQGRHAFYKNGYQSWTASQVFFAHEKELVPRLSHARRMQENERNLPTGRRGEFCADLFGVLGNLDTAGYLLAGQLGGFSQGFYVRAALDPWRGHPRRLTLIWDFGGVVLPAGATRPLDAAALLAGTEPCRLQEEWLRRLGPPVGRREPPVGWCSWYQYGTRVRQEDFEENLREAVQQAAGWSFFQLDDGYATEVGDWLSLRPSFSRGLGSLARQVQEAGLQPGLWFAPFLASRAARLFREHPGWFLHDEQGRPLPAGFNPLWGLDGRIYALDTTHPEFQEQLRRVVRTFVDDWGFRLLKLDFLYAAALPGVAHDPTRTPAERLALGYQLVREAAGPEVLLLGCGAPLAPSIGQVDLMRIGPDVAPFWFPTFRYHLTRDPHALSAAFAIRSTVNRSPLQGRLWTNDPDCVLLREEDTSLTAAERTALLTAVAITGGVVLDSDRLARLPPHAWTRLQALVDAARACSHGTVQPLDFMEKKTSELVYNSAGYLAVFHLGDRAAHRRVDHQRWLAGRVPADRPLTSLWDGRVLQVTDGWLDLGVLPPHSAVLLCWSTP